MIARKATRLTQGDFSKLTGVPPRMRALLDAMHASGPDRWLPRRLILQNYWLFEEPEVYEVLQTVVSFSNTFGGRVYVGVEDDGTVQGESELRKIGQAGEKQALASMVKHIGKVIRDKIKPVPDFDVDPVAVFGSPIVVVSVRPGEDAPYATSDNDVFLRKGATNRKPDPRTELPSIVERARERSERRPRQERDDAMAASSYQKGDDQD